jgi:hypothetical protein
LGKVSSRKRRYPRSQVLGLYHGAHREGRAWIELFVDNIAATTPRYGQIPIVRDLSFGKVLFHEIGHHAHATVAPEHREKEDVAGAWAKKLGKKFMRRKYWFLIPLLPLLRAWARCLPQ